MATAKNHRAMKMRDPLYMFLIFLIYDGRQPEAKIDEIFKFHNFETPEMSLLKYLLTNENG